MAAATHQVAALALGRISHAEASIAAFDRGRDPSPAVRRHGPTAGRACVCAYEDGAVELWNTASPDNLSNLRCDPPDVILDSFQDVICAIAIERGALFLESFIEDVAPLTLRRAKAVSSATRFNTRALADPKTRLYVTLRALQYLVRVGRVPSAALVALTPRSSTWHSATTRIA